MLLKCKRNLSYAPMKTEAFSWNVSKVFWSQSWYQSTLFFHFQCYVSYVNQGWRLTIRDRDHHVLTDPNDGKTKLHTGQYPEGEAALCCSYVWCTEIRSISFLERNHYMYVECGVLDEFIVQLARFEHFTLDPTLDTVDNPTCCWAPPPYVHWLLGPTPLCPLDVTQWSHAFHIFCFLLVITSTKTVANWSCSSNVLCKMVSNSNVTTKDTRLKPTTNNNKQQQQILVYSHILHLGLLHTLTSPSLHTASSKTSVSRDLVRVCVPLPHVTEHADHGDQVE